MFPPVETGLFKLEENKQDYYVTAGRFVSFKRLDLAVDAFTRMPDKKLIVVGDGPEMARLRAKAGPNIEFPGFQPPTVVRKYLAHARAFIFPSEEDFGIVPVEAQACGTPVIAFGSGGALETVIGLDDVGANGYPTGLFFDRQEPESLIEAIRHFENNEHRFIPRAISEHAANFHPERFRGELKWEIEAALSQQNYKLKSRHVEKRSQVVIGATGTEDMETGARVEAMNGCLDNANLQRVISDLCQQDFGLSV